MAKELNIEQLEWTNFLRRVYFYKKPHESDQEFLNRIELSRQKKSDWYYKGHRILLSESIKVINKLKVSQEEEWWLLRGTTSTFFVPVSDSGMFEVLDYL